MHLESSISVFVLRGYPFPCLPSKYLSCHRPTGDNQHWRGQSSEKPTLNSRKQTPCQESKNLRNTEESTRLTGGKKKNAWRVLSGKFLFSPGKGMMSLSTKIVFPPANSYHFKTPGCPESVPCSFRISPFILCFARCCLYFVWIPGWKCKMFSLMVHYIRDCMKCFEDIPSFSLHTSSCRLVVSITFKN